MGKGKVRNPPGEHFTKIIRHTMEEPAWRALSSTAQALYSWVKLEWRGPDANNNGKIRLSVRQAAACMGCAPDTAAEGFRDLQRKGFLFQTEAACLGVEGAAKCPSYEITEIKMPGTDKQQDGRKLYRDWRQDQEFPVKGPSANNPTGANGQRRKTKSRHENNDDPVLTSMTNRRRAS
ncbi:hypothetical protein EOB59_03225 [Mesorhizobium sp. M7A.F.Ca.MR.176.00.0.0]|uniref:hypothetical protein n=1 Tax=Mesorhizobium sp. M7A.F.Ca.MR.176.00.0.0 TaxID=2496776 RepID=UPI000FD1D29B|nr:hypothetical protein [Mesorhizobium sp. M7A.F.Ca.MR.176.00.0.0]RUU93329.1 hypothetical protein EOB59_03225 [Mesorhizobium sp. M7A.F.Ca.MR.176.00.0.0]